jgi:hypothetical protein
MGSFDPQGLDVVVSVRDPLSKAVLGGERQPSRRDRCPGADACSQLACLQRGPAATMSEQKKVLDRVTFGHGYDVCIMAIDGTWRRDCILQAVSETDAVLTVEGSVQGLNLKEFFLLLSSTGLAYRRCELVRVNGAEMDVQFLKAKARKKKQSSSSN